MVRTKTWKKSGSLPEEVAVEQTIHIAKYLKGRTWKRRAPLAILNIRKVVERTMGTKDVRIDSSLNNYIWAQGIKGVPRRVRIMMERKRSTDENADGELFTVVKLVAVSTKSGEQGFKSLLTKVFKDGVPTA